MTDEENIEQTINLEPDQEPDAEELSELHFASSAELRRGVSEMVNEINRLRARVSALEQDAKPTEPPNQADITQ